MSLAFVVSCTLLTLSQIYTGGCCSRSALNPCVRGRGMELNDVLNYVVLGFIGLILERSSKLHSTPAPARLRASEEPA